MRERFEVRVIPNASRDEIQGWAEGCLRVKLRAVPEGGRANRALLELLAGQLGCRARDLRLLSGKTGRQKVLEVPEGSLERLVARDAAGPKFPR